MEPRPGVARPVQRLERAFGGVDREPEPARQPVGAQRMVVVLVGDDHRFERSRARSRPVGSAPRSRGRRSQRRSGSVVPRTRPPGSCRRYPSRGRQRACFCEALLGVGNEEVQAIGPKVPSKRRYHSRPFDRKARRQLARISPAEMRLQSLTPRKRPGRRSAARGARVAQLALRRAGGRRGARARDSVGGRVLRKPAPGLQNR